MLNVGTKKFSFMVRIILKYLLNRNYIFSIKNMLWVLFTVASIQTTFAQTGWTVLPPSQTPRIEGHCAVYNGKFYLFGGFQSYWTVTNKVEVYNPATNSWSYLASMPLNTTHWGHAVHGDNAYFVGGFGTKSTQIYNFTTNTWKFGPSLPADLSAFGMAVLGNKIHTVGGTLPNKTTDVSDHWVLELDNLAKGWYKMASVPDGRNHLSAAVVGGKLYAIGGQFHHNGTNKVDLALVHEYDPYTNTWTRKADIPKVTSHHEPGTFTYDGKIVITGGTSWTYGHYNNIRQYDPFTNTWVDLPPMPYKAIAPNAKLIGNKMYLQGGGTGSGPLKDFNVRTISRASTDKLGFHPAVVSVSLPSASTAKKEVYLWTLSNKVSYSINTSALPSWLSVSPATGTTLPEAAEIDLSFNSSGLANGTYNATITASAPGYTSVNLPVQLVVGSGGPVNQNPVVNAGADKSLTLPTNSVTLNGSATDDGSIAGWMWSKVSGPSATMSGANTADLALSNLVAGSYVFNLTVTDDKGATGTDNVNVTVSSAPVSGSAVRINCGGTAFTTTDGRTFAADKYFSTNTSTYTNNNITDILGTSHDALYKTERSPNVALGSFSYNIPVANGNYNVVLHFAEIWFGATGGKPAEGQTGKRVFSVNLEGAAKLTNYDIIAEVGTMTAVTKSFSANITDGNITLDFSTGVNRAKISAIEIIPVTTPSPSSAVRISCGGGAYTATDGRVFAADKNYTTNTSTYVNNNITDILGTTEDALYKKERSANINLGSFSYNIPVTNGNYTVLLHFAEIWYGATGGRPAEGQPGKRIFSLNIEGSPKLTNYDIIAEVGTMTAVVKSFDVSVADGSLTLDFSASVNRPKISAIEVIPAPAGPLANTGNNDIGVILADNVKVSAFPNPFTERLYLQITPVQNGLISVDIFDAKGNLFNRLYNGNVEAGRTLNLEMDGSGLKGGLYLSRITLNGKIKQQKLILQK